MVEWARTFAALGVAMLLGCEAEPSAKVSLADIGDPCRSQAILCFDEGSVQRCIDEVWALSTCDAVCAEIGPAYFADGCDEAEQCVCALADPSGCTPGESACADADTVEVCDEAQAWGASSCVEVCANLERASEGCAPASEPDAEAGCVCTLEGTACEATLPPLCADGSTLARCMEGLWVFEDCASICGAPAPCDPLATPHDCDC